MDKRTIELIKRRVDALENNTGLRVGISYTNTWKDGSETFEFKSIPSDESVKAAAMDIRHFLAKDSNLTMGKLVRQLRAQEGIDIEKLDKFYEIWRMRTGDKPPGHAPIGIKLVLNDEHLTLRKQIDLWMNGELFHTDVEKADLLAEMSFTSFKSTSWMIFVSTIQELAKLLIYFRNNFIRDNSKSRL